MDVFALAAIWAVERNTMKTAIILGTLLMATLVGLAAEPAAAAPVPCGGTVDPDSGSAFVYCRPPPPGGGCVYVSVGDPNHCF